MHPKIDNGFVKADLENHPKIYMFKVFEYFTSYSKYGAPDIRGVEAAL